MSGADPSGICLFAKIESPLLFSLSLRYLGSYFRKPETCRAMKRCSSSSATHSATVLRNSAENPSETQSPNPIHNKRRYRPLSGGGGGEEKLEIYNSIKNPNKNCSGKTRSDPNKTRGKKKHRFFNFFFHGNKGKQRKPEQAVRDSFLELENGSTRLDLVEGIISHSKINQSLNF